MKQPFYLYRRGETNYLQDSRTDKQQSLETKDRNAALRLLEIKRQTPTDPGYSHFILKSFLSAAAKNVMPFGGGLLNDFKRFDETRIGPSCG